ncbi:hypothetical protein PIB30_004528 [Stylosanthes scabra]|uniref:HpcH/HpaI aldolase/citrate lyase domain-containing protein n=1 Tax=Stylosanthes scabra TaxID=79078 RepID=A0ABU6X295_9FABA|nr:hypothetical protein [Stylosanthes scabra]
MASTATISLTPPTTTAFLSSLLPKPHSILTPSYSLFKPKPFKPLTAATTTTTRPNTLRIPKSYAGDVASALSASAATTAGSSPRNLRSRLQNGETLYGLFHLTFSPTLAEIAGLAGYDFVVIDMEHGHGGISDALPCLHALAATGTAAILRVPESSATWAKKALDLGPQGIMFPMIESAESAIDAVSFCRFPPAGIRGSAHTVVRASGYGIDEGYLGSYQEELLIMCQVESVEGVKNIGQISAVDGVDCIQMGPLDLSASMGYLWDPGNKKVRQLMREAEEKVLESRSGGGVGVGAYLSGFAMPHDGPRDLKSRGYHMVSGAVDVGLFRSAAVEDVKKFRMSLIEEESDYSEKEEDKDGDEKYWSE